MIWGLIVRSETDRGLGIQTLAMYRELQPDRTLVVDNHKSGFALHPELYPDATFVSLQHGPDKNRLDETIVRDWMSGLDAVVSVETLYDWDLVRWAHDAGCVTIVHGNPEFALRDHNSNPDVWWWPTKWRPHEHMPPSDEMIIVSVPINREPVEPMWTDNVRFIHVHGSGAVNDRNGTMSLLNDYKKLTLKPKLIITSQEPFRLPLNGARVIGNLPNRWDIYDYGSVLVMPRKYGGLCLPTIEAAASGLAVIMTSCPPNIDWPIIDVPVYDPGQRVHVQGGDIIAYTALPGSIAAQMRSLHADPQRTHNARLHSWAWAQANTWDAHRQTYYDRIDEAVRSLR